MKGVFPEATGLAVLLISFCLVDIPISRTYFLAHNGSYIGMPHDKALTLEAFRRHWVLAYLTD